MKRRYKKETILHGFGGLAVGPYKTGPSGPLAGFRFIDDDWFRYWYPPATPDEAVGNAEAQITEVHELCDPENCSFYPGVCKWQKQ